MKRWEARHSQRAAAPPSAVWVLWEDSERWPEWNRDIVSSELHGPFAEGSRARVRLRRSPPLTFTIAKLEPQRLFVDEARLPGARMGHEHRLEPDGDGVVIEHALYFEGPLARLYGAAMGRRMRASVRAFGAAEQAIAERTG